MSGQTFGNLILWLIVIVVVVAIVVYLLRWLYRRSTKETSFVRTGFFGQKVVINGGAFVIPVLHDVTPVNMNVMRIEVARSDQDALITRDRMRVDVIAEFYVRVQPTSESVANAAQTLGRRTLEPSQIRELLEGKFVSALRTAAAGKSLVEMHEQRNDYIQQARDLASEALLLNGLELESVALVDVDQTSVEFFDPSNVFDAEGLSQLTESIETRRKQRNDVEQRSMVEIRARNLEAEQQVLEIDREGEYSRLDQEREVEMRRAAQRTDIARERALREQESEQAQIAAREEVEKARISHERVLSETRIGSEEETQRREIVRKRAIDESELRASEQTERERIALELALERERIARNREQQRLEVEARREVEVAERERSIALALKAMELTDAETQAKSAEIDAERSLEQQRIARDQKVDEVRVERERTLELLQVSRRQAFAEAEVSADEEVERARIASERGLAEARVVRDRDVRTLEVERERAVEIAQMEREIALAEKSQARSSAQAEAESARAAAIEAEERAFTAREQVIAERRKLVELIATALEVEREGMQVTARAQAQKEAAESLADATRTEAQAKADAERILSEAARIRYEVDAAGQSELNEAENLLSDAARVSRLRQKLLERIEGIVRESVKPMERIEGIKILHVDGLGKGEGGTNVTDEVIDSALRYRVQAPLIDNLMKDIGIGGGSLDKMTDILRTARDVDGVKRSSRSTAEASAPEADTSDGERGNDG